MTEVKIIEYKAVNKGALQGFLSIELVPSTMQIRDLTHFKKGDNEWFNMPQKEYTNKDGEKKYYATVFYEDTEIRERFMESLSVAFKKYMAEEQEPTAVASDDACPF
jgi:hypothetical protein